MREDPYNLQGRIKAVTRRIENSTAISKTNKQLIFQFCDQATLQGLSQARILFYLNRFWNLARYVKKDFNRLTRNDIEELVRKVQNNGFSPRPYRTIWSSSRSSGNGLKAATKNTLTRSNGSNQNII